MKYTSEELSLRAAEMVLYFPRFLPTVIAPEGGLEAAEHLVERKTSDSRNAEDHIIAQTSRVGRPRYLYRRGLL
jgi:hypothetical protein